MSVKTADMLSKIATSVWFLCHLELVESAVWFEAIDLDWCSKNDFLAPQNGLGALKNPGLLEPSKAANRGGACMHRGSERRVSNSKTFPDFQVVWEPCF